MLCRSVHSDTRPRPTTHLREQRVVKVEHGLGVAEGGDIKTGIFDQPDPKVHLGGRGESKFRIEIFEHNGHG